MIAIIILTYHPANLRISLSRLRWLDFDFFLLVHNDNPLHQLSSSDLFNYGLPDNIPFKILNEKKNLGCFDSRLESVRYLIENYKDVTHFMFCDDDDTLLYPKIHDTAWISNQRGVTVHRLKEVLELLVPKPKVHFNEFIKDEGIKAGCVGPVYRTSLWGLLIPVIDKFKPKLYEWYGSSRVMETDDIYYAIMIRNLLMRNYGTLNGFFHDFDSYGYALTLLEDRVGRYHVEPGVRDLRYGVWDGKTTYEQMATEFILIFGKFLKTL